MHIFDITLRLHFRPRAAGTVYESDYCVRLDEFRPRINGITMTKTSVDGSWRRPGDGTMAVIPTK